MTGVRRPTPRPTEFRRALAATLLLVVLGANAGATSGAQPTPTPTRTPTPAPDPAPGTSGRSIRVATKPLEPFVFNDGELRGYSIDLWDEVAGQLGAKTEWVEYQTVAEVLAAVETGEADVGIAGISMTPEREARVDFSHPVFDSGLQVAVRKGDGNGPIRSLLPLLARRAVLLPLGGLALLVVAVAHVVWWTERRHNEAFPHGYRSGIWEALWWSTVSVIGGGSSADVRRPLSRLLALFWMIVGLFLIAYVTARATSVLTVQQLQTSITGLEDLPGKKVITVSETVSADYLREQNIDFSGVADIDTALTQLVDGDAEAVVFDAPVLAYRAGTDLRGRVELLDKVYNPDKYGIALRSGSELREPINEAILLMSRDGTTADLRRKWFRDDS